MAQCPEGCGRYMGQQQDPRACLPLVRVCRAPDSQVSELKGALSSFSQVVTQALYNLRGKGPECG